MKSCLLCGVGGQGTVLASRILAEAAMEQGFFARTAETIGMAQRGGCVVSHVRFGDGDYGSMIPYGMADVIIGFEPGETVRNLKYLKKDGMVVVCDRPVWPVTMALSGEAWHPEKYIEYLREKVKNVFVVSADQVENELGSARALNVALVGAAVATGVLGLEEKSVEAVLARKVKPQYIEMNKKALKLGAEVTEV